MEAATEVFWHADRDEWLESANAGSLLVFDEGENHVLVMYAAEKVADLEELNKRADEPGFVQMLALGDPEPVSDALDLLRQQAEDGTLATLPGRGVLPTPTRAMIQDNTRDGLSDHHMSWLGEHVGHEWIFFYALEKIATPKQDEHVQKLGPEWISEVERVITASNPITSALRDIDKLTWYGYVDGNLLAGAMGVDRTEHSDGTTGSHFSGLGTDPAMQGNGVGGAVMAGTINRELEETDAATFGMWSWNEKARRLYNRLGITEGHEYITYSRHPLPEYE